jgi:TonB family protein
MSDTTDTDRMRGLAKPAILLLIAAAIATGLWFALHDVAGVRRAAPPPTLIAILPPPPPPPPTPQEPPEPEKQLETPKPEEQPRPQDQAPPPLTINGPAQAGGDAFGIGAGSGGGMALGGRGDGEGGGGSAFADSAYSRFLGSEVQQAVQNDDRINRQVFTADVDIWVDSGGRVTRARIRRGTGDDRLDKSLVATLERLGALSEPPPAAFKFPQRVAIRGRRGV